MKPVVLWMIAAMFFVLAACGTSPTQKGRELAKELVYFKDSRTGLCFAFWKNPSSPGTEDAVLANVPCEKVEAFLINGDEKDPCPMTDVRPARPPS